MAGVGGVFLNLKGCGATKRVCHRRGPDHGVGFCPCHVGKNVALNQAVVTAPRRHGACGIDAL